MLLLSQQLISALEKEGVGERGGNLIDENPNAFMIITDTGKVIEPNDPKEFMDYLLYHNGRLGIYGRL